MSRDTSSLVHGFHSGVETAVGLGMIGLLTAGRDAAADRAAQAARLSAARAGGEATALQAVVDRLRDELACSQADARVLRKQLAALAMDNEILREMVLETA